MHLFQILMCAQDFFESKFDFISASDAADPQAQQEDAPQLMRTRSDVGVRRRGNLRTPSEQRRIRRHRFSINGHFYNHKVSRSPEQTPLEQAQFGHQLLGEIYLNVPFLISTKSSTIALSDLAFYLPTKSEQHNFLYCCQILNH